MTNCSGDFVLHTSDSQLEVSWFEPSFSDPHGLVNPVITAQNYYEPKAVFPWGDHTVQYVATKQNNGMQTECAFQISVYRKFVFRNIQNALIICCVFEYLGINVVSSIFH